MVKLFAVSVFYKANDAKLLKSAYDLQSFSFFQRSSVQEFIGYVWCSIPEQYVLHGNIFFIFASFPSIVFAINFNHFCHLMQFDR